MLADIPPAPPGVFVGKANVDDSGSKLDASSAAASVVAAGAGTRVQRAETLAGATSSTAMSPGSRSSRIDTEHGQLSAHSVAADDVETASDERSGGPALSERVMQQLRGIFAAHDEDKDLMLDYAELADAVRALGFTPTPELLQCFMERRPQELRSGGLLDLSTFLLVATEQLQSERRFSSDMLELFELFDDRRTGTITLSSLRHILHETLTPERLSQAELDEFMEYAGLRKLGGYGVGLREARVDYNALLDKLMMLR